VLTRQFSMSGKAINQNLGIASFPLQTRKISR
jgi:hypothetical protein